LLNWIAAKQPFVTGSNGSGADFQSLFMQRLHLQTMMKRLFVSSAVRRAFGSASAFLKSAGEDDPPLYPGPCAAVRRGRQAT
jgi:hypothetical protein